jgi:hypothetical protein
MSTTTFRQCSWKLMFLLIFVHELPCQDANIFCWCLGENILKNWPQSPFRCHAELNKLWQLCMYICMCCNT